MLEVSAASTIAFTSIRVFGTVDSARKPFGPRLGRVRHDGGAASLFYFLRFLASGA